MLFPRKILFQGYIQHRNVRCTTVSAPAQVQVQIQSM